MQWGLFCFSNFQGFNIECAVMRGGIDLITLIWKGINVNPISHNPGLAIIEFLSTLHSRKQNWIRSWYNYGEYHIYLTYRIQIYLIDKVKYLWSNETTLKLNHCAMLLPTFTLLFLHQFGLKYFEGYYKILYHYYGMSSFSSWKDLLPCYCLIIRYSKFVKINEQNIKMNSESIYNLAQHLHIHIHIYVHVYITNNLLRLINKLDFPFMVNDWMRVEYLLPRIFERFKFPAAVI